MTVKKPVRPYKTVNARPGPETMLKPGELIDVVEMSPLILVDRRTYNLLIANAWEAIDQPVRHVIAKSELRGLHESNDRIGESIERLMTAFVRVYTQVNGKRNRAGAASRTNDRSPRPGRHALLPLF